jgi:hypothetical protein
VRLSSIDFFIGPTGRADATLCVLHEPEKESLLLLPGLLASRACVGTEFGQFAVCIGYSVLHLSNSSYIYLFVSGRQVTM